jgi:hypothetical protein
MGKAFALFCILDGLAGIGFALVFLLAPDQGFLLFGIAADPAGYVMARLAGSQLLAWGVVMLIFRKQPPSRTLAMFLLWFGLADLLMASVFFRAHLSGVVNGLGLVVAVMCAGFCVLFLYFSRIGNPQRGFEPSIHEGHEREGV